MLVASGVPVALGVSVEGCVGDEPAVSVGNGELEGDGDPPSSTVGLGLALGLGLEIGLGDGPTGLGSTVGTGSV